MTIQEAIRARIDRFNRLYLAAVGHSFEADPKWCEEPSITIKRMVNKGL